MNKQSILTRMRRKFKDKKGQSTTEYILILAIVVMMASKMKGKMTTFMDGSMKNVEKQMEDVTSP